MKLIANEIFNDKLKLRSFWFRESIMKKILLALPFLLVVHNCVALATQNFERLRHLSDEEFEIESSKMSKIELGEFNKFAAKESAKKDSQLEERDRQLQAKDEEIARHAEEIARLRAELAKRK